MKAFCGVATAAVAGFLAWSSWGQSRPPEVPFRKITIDLGASETCAFADINGDGAPDIVSGENWYEAPKWLPHAFRTLPYRNGYIDNFTDLPLDVDGDGRIDVVSCTYFTRRIAWWKNPGAHGGWSEHSVEDKWPVEFMFAVDIDNDGKARELLPQYGDERAPLAWYEAKDGRYVEHVVSPHSYGHGIGAGDVNGDGRTDILTPKGWFEAPADPRSGQWTWHPDFDLGTTGYIHVADLNGDGRRDLVSSAAHDYGLYWMEQGAGGKWTKHVIDDSWSQVHAVVIADVNGDSKPDLLTGKRYMAHDHDPGAREPLGVYWYEHLKAPGGNGLAWVKHIIDYSTRTGAGIQIAVEDIDRDGDLDFAVGGKSGLFLFENLRRGRPRP